MTEVVADVHGGHRFGASRIELRAVTPDGRELRLRLPSTGAVIGRDDACDLALPSSAISRRHCTLIRRAKDWVVQDHSRHGTWVGSTRVDGEAPWPEDQPLEVGDWRLWRRPPGDVDEPTLTRAARPATHEVVARAADGSVVQAYVRVLRGEYQASRIAVERARVTLGGPESGVVLDPLLPKDAVTLRVVRARVMLEPGAVPAFIAGERVRATMPIWEGEPVQVGDVVFTVGTRVVGPTADAPVLDGIVGDSDPMIALRTALARVARHDAPVLLLGATGTGKELAARAVHEAGPRASGPFVPVNAGSLPDALVVSELFGHAAGAFTGASEDRPGAFMEADGGTLFLDEVGDMSLSAQAKVLRALQEGKITPVGGDKSINVNVRVIAATNKDLKAEIAEGKFREDLYHRLAVILIKVPALDERKDDIPLLVEHFVQQLSAQDGMAAKTFTDDAIKRLQDRSWTGNIRELRNVVERLIILGADEVTAEDVEKYV